MKEQIQTLCDELDKIRAEQEQLRRRQIELNTRSYELDSRLKEILHSELDPLLNGHWNARITLYKDDRKIKA
jgi:predicted transcriptional regulator